MISHIHSATVLVSDQNATLVFYVEALGWEKRADDPYEIGGASMRWIEVVPPGATTSVALVRPEDVGAPPEAAGSYRGLSVVADDLEGAYEALRDRGVNFTGPPERCRGGTRPRGSTTRTETASSLSGHSIRSRVPG